MSRFLSQDTGPDFHPPELINLATSGVVTSGTEAILSLASIVYPLSNKYCVKVEQGKYKTHKYFQNQILDFQII